MKLLKELSGAHHLNHLLLSLLLASCLATASLAEPRLLTKSGTVHLDEEAKVEFTLPGLGWAAAEGTASDNFELQLARPFPNARVVLFSAVPHQGEPYMDLDSYAATMSTWFNTESEDFELLELTRGEHLGVPFIRQNAKFKNGAHRFKAACVVLVSNHGFVRLFIAAETPTLGFDGFVEDTIERVRWTDPQVGKPSGTLKGAAGVWSSPNFGYSVDLGKGASFRPDLSPRADLNALCMDEPPTLFAFAARIEGEALTPEEIAAAMLPSVEDKDNVDELAVSSLPVVNGLERIRIRWKDVQEPATVGMADVVRYGSDFLLVGAEVDVNMADTDAALESALKRFTVPKDTSAWARGAEFNKNSAMAINDLGVYFAKNSNPTAAERWFRRSIEVFATDLTFHTNLAFVLSEQGKHEEALAALSAVPAELQQSADYHQQRGSALSQLERNQAAIEAYAAAFAAGMRDPDSIDTYVHLLAREGRAQEAVKILLNLEAETKDPLFTFYRASVLEDAGQRDDGLAILREQHAIAPGDAPISTGLAWMLIRGGHLSEAIEVAHSIPAEGRLRYARTLMLAEAWLQTGDRNKAKEYVDQLMELNPEAPATQSILKRLEAFNPDPVQPSEPAT